MADLTPERIAELKALCEALQKLRESPDCPHGEEKWYCDGCDYAWDEVATPMAVALPEALARIEACQQELATRDEQVERQAEVSIGEKVAFISGLLTGIGTAMGVYVVAFW